MATCKQKRQTSELSDIFKNYKKRKDAIATNSLKLTLNHTKHVSQKDTAKSLAKKFSQISKSARTTRKTHKAQTDTISEKSKFQYRKIDTVSVDDPEKILNNFTAIVTAFREEQQKEQRAATQNVIDLITQTPTKPLPEYKERCNFTLAETLYAEFHELYLLCLRAKREDSFAGLYANAETLLDQTHTCRLGKCTFFYYPSNTCFQSFFCNPSHVFRATGLVYVCASSGAAHICNAATTTMLMSYNLPPCQTLNGCCIVSGQVVRVPIEQIIEYYDVGEEDDDITPIEHPTAFDTEKKKVAPDVISKHKEFVNLAMKHADDKKNINITSELLSTFSGVIKTQMQIDINKIETCVRKILITDINNNSSKKKKKTFRTLMQKIQAYVLECERQNVPIFYDVLESIEAATKQEQYDSVYNVDDESIRLYCRYISVVLKLLNRTIIVNNNSISSWYEPISFTVLYIMSNGGLNIQGIQVLPAIPELSLHSTFMHKNNHCNSVNTYQDKIVAAYKSNMERMDSKNWHKLAHDYLVVNK